MKDHAKVSYRGRLAATGSRPLLHGGWQWTSWWYSHREDAEAATDERRRVNEAAGVKMLESSIETSTEVRPVFIRHRCGDRFTAKSPTARGQRCGRCGRIVH